MSIRLKRKRLSFIIIDDDEIMGDTESTNHTVDKTIFIEDSASESESMSTDNRAPENTSTTVIEIDDDNEPPRRLPAQIIANFVRYVSQQNDLYQCTLVNICFHMASNPILWRSPQFKNEERMSLFMDTMALNRKYLGHFIRHIHSKNHHDFTWSDAHLMVLSHHANLLESLVLPYTNNIRNTTIQFFVRRCPYLQHFHLGVNTTTTQFTHNTIVTIGNACRKLKLLYLNHCAPNLRNNVFSTLPGCPLRHLSITFFRHQVRFLNTKMVALDLGALFHLIHLTIHHLPVHNDDLGNLLLEIKGTTPWKDMIYLDLQQDDDDGGGTNRGIIGDSTLVPFLRANHMRLQTLKLDGCMFTDDAFDILCFKSKLSELYVARNTCITYDGIRRLIKRCPQINKMTSNECPGILKCHFPEVPGLLAYDVSPSSINVCIDMLSLDRIRQNQMDATLS